VNVASVILRDNRKTADLVDGLEKCFADAQRRGWHRAAAGLALSLAFSGAAVFVWVVRHDFDLFFDVLESVPYDLVATAASYPMATLLGSVLAVGLGLIARRMWLAAHLTRYLADHADVNPKVVGEAQRVISVRRPEMLFKASSVAIGAFLLVTGALWAGLVFVATTAALDCARSSKCL
jgi:hypothetical protein